jgi:hypothetical protein
MASYYTGKYWPEKYFSGNYWARISGTFLGTLKIIFGIRI